MDPEKRTVQVSDLSGTTVYPAGAAIPVMILGGGSVPVEQIFAV